MELRDIAERLGLRVSDRPAPPPRRQPKPPPGRARRPAAIVEMVGQDRARTMLSVRVRGARLRGEHPGHVLLFGPPGLGKTTLAELVAHETGGNLVRAIGSQLSAPLVLGRTLTELGRRSVDVLFIDEIHALPRAVEELLYLAMEDGRIELTTGKGEDARVQSIELPPFILVGATTLPGWLSQPFRDRFATKLSLEYYSEAELTLIIARAAEKKGAKIDPDAAAMLGRRSRGTPRIALSLFMAAWDFTVAMAGSIDVPITTDTVEHALALEEIDALGLTRDDRTVLETICVAHRGGPIGLENLAASVGVDSRTLDGAIEPYLIRAGLLRRTRRGRVATTKAFEHLGLEAPLTVDDLSAHTDAAWEERS